MDDDVKGFTFYDSGLSYAHAYRVLLDRFNSSKQTLDYKDASLIMPALSDGAFACELFMKSLLNNGYGNTHRLYSDLFQSLDSGTQSFVKDLVISSMKDKKSSPNYNELDFEKDFKGIDTMFMDIRYAFEAPQKRKTQNEIAYNIGFVDCLIAVLQVVCINIFGERPIKA